MEKVSNEQVIDGSGSLISTIVTTGLKPELQRGGLRAPSYEEAALLLGADATKDLFTISTRQLSSAAYSDSLAGLRVMAAVVDSGQRKLFLPGILVADKGSLRVGCLRATPDIRSGDSTSVTTPLSDYQQLLLAKLYAQHQPESGGHHGGVNAAEVNHASLIAASDPSVDIHHTVHRLVDGGSFSAQVANSGATDIATPSGLRPNNEIILGLPQVAGIAVAKVHQAPLPFAGNGFDVSAGFILAARRTQGKGADHILRANIEGMA